MIRLILCVLIATASTVTGLIFSLETRLRSRIFVQLINMLTRIEIKISFEKTEVPRLLDELRRCGDFDMLESLLCTEKSADTPCCLKPDESRRLRQIIESLGTTDEQGQLAMIGLAKAEFTLLSEEARENERKNAKLFAALGVLGGVFAAVILI